jgi:hypothetical protein
MRWPHGRLLSVMSGQLSRSAIRTTMLDMTDRQPVSAAAVPQQAQTAVVEVHPETTIQPTAGTGNLASEEYQTLRAEIIARIQKQQDVMNFAILVITAVLTYAGFAKFSSSTLGRTIAILGAPASLALSVFALMTLDHEMNIAHATRYIYEILRPEWIKATGADKAKALGWNFARAKWQQPKGPVVVLPTTIAAAKYYAITGLNFLLIVTSWVEYARSATRFANFSLALLSFATVLLAVTLVASAYTSSIWLKMKQDANQ